VGPVHHLRLPGAPIDRAEEHLRAIVAGRVHQPGDAEGTQTRVRVGVSASSAWSTSTTTAVGSSVAP
jgi:hypothetical protein